MSLWSAEVVVDEALAHTLIADPFPELRGATVAPFGSGWDNTAFLVGGEWVFRFPRRQAAVAAMEAEIRALPALAGRLPLPVPVPRFLGQPGPRFRWPFAGYRLLAGRTADRAVLDDAQRLAAAPVLGRFLAALHASPTDGLSPDPWGRLDPARLREPAETALAYLATHGVADADGLRRAFAALSQHQAPARPQVLAHGDLDGRHVLVDDHGAPAGVIDWGDVHLGDPAVDLALAHSFLPPAAHDAFRDAYGGVDDATWRLARMRALFGVILDLHWAHDTGDEAVLKQAMRAVAWLA